ncbi:hypothetical protein HPB50_015591 [Hyalomma asiaticum]|uniref:Uncharacterized protein n=1 Tax=Hyalomma asiaticum TaxID=266040 RepID=A0ACB7SYU1_HYAAI|nr:hypothetical protein HPB50_015591 [Hyalomma asiaticum]
MDSPEDISFYTGLPNFESFMSFLRLIDPGSVSDKELVEKSGFLNLQFQPGDSVMADKGLKIQDLLSAKGVALNIPPFLQRQRLTEEEVKSNRRNCKPQNTCRATHSTN